MPSNAQKDRKAAYQADEKLKTLATAKDAAVHIRDHYSAFYKACNKNQLQHWCNVNGWPFSGLDLLIEIRRLRSPGKLTGDALKAAQEATQAGQQRAAAYQAMMNGRMARLEEADSLTEQAHALLIQAGGVLDKVSESGSRYYTVGEKVIRISDHAANEATSEWLDRAGGWSIDLGARNPIEQLKVIITDEKN